MCMDAQSRTRSKGENMVRLTVALSEADWRWLRRQAEDSRPGAGRASVTGVVRRLIEREASESRLSAGTVEKK